MPYIIAVLAFVVIGVGYTLFQSNPETNEETISLNTLVEEIKETATEDGPVPATEESEVAPEAATPIKEETPAKTNPSTPAPTPTPEVPAPSTPVSNSTYTNGTYRTSSTYRTPDGTYTMDVSLTMSNDIVTGATLNFDADGARDGYSKRFSKAYQSEIIGQELEGLNVSRVGGASLTTRAFNSALASIRNQAS